MPCGQRSNPPAGHLREARRQVANRKGELPSRPSDELPDLESAWPILRSARGFGNRKVDGGLAFHEAEPAR